jgi:hypothetical protein
MGLSINEVKDMFNIKNLNRRDFLISSAGFAGVVLGASSLFQLAGCESEQPCQILTPQERIAPSFLIRPYREGDFLIENWKIGSISFENQGYITTRIINENEQKEIRVDLFAKRGEQKGFISTDRVDFFIMNNGKARTKTPEEVAKVVNALANEIKNNEQKWTELTRLIPFDPSKCIDVF